MYFIALATDFDGTIAEDGIVAEATLEALRELKRSERRLLLVTGRQLSDLIFPDIRLFNMVVAENGAVLFDPKTGVETLLAPAPPPVFVEALRARDVPVSEGRSIVATWEPHQNAVLDVIRELGLELQIVFNKGAVMVLPAGVNKASGLEAALALLELSAHNVVGIGDAENDHAFLRSCGFAVAVANALPMLKEASDFVTEEPRGAGVVALARRMMVDDLAGLTERQLREAIEIGLDERMHRSGFPRAMDLLLIAGMSGGGKSTAASGFLERIQKCRYQFCVIDPEGDYTEFEDAVTLGDAKHEPRVEEAVELLRHAKENVVVNLLGVQLEERPGYFIKLFAQICQLRAEIARPHWTLIDEAHHMMPPEWPAAASLATGIARDDPRHCPSRSRRAGGARDRRVCARRWFGSRGDAALVLRRAGRGAARIERRSNRAGRCLSLGAKRTPAPPRAGSWTAAAHAAAHTQIRGRRTRGGPQLLFPGAGSPPEPSGAKSGWCFFRSRKGSMTRPGCITCAWATTRDGWRSPSRIGNSPVRLP